MSSSNQNPRSKSKEFRHLILGLKAGYVGGVTPYKVLKGWDFKLEFDSGVIRKWICYSEFTLCNLYMIHLFTGWIWSLMVNNPNSPRRIGLQYMFFCSCIPWSMQLNNFLHYGHLHFLINSFIHLYSEEAPSGDGETEGGEGGFSTFLRNLRRIGTIVTALNLMAVVRRPFLPYLFTSRIPNIKNLHPIVKGPLLTIQFYAFVTQWLSVYGKMGQVSAYLRVILACLNKLKRDPKKTKKWTEDGADKFFVAIMAIILGILAGFRVSGPQGLRPILAGGASLLMLLFVWIKMAEVNESSEEVLHSWKCRTRRDEFTKFLHSNLPIRIGLGTFFFADRSLILTILSIIINNTVTLLVAH